MPKKKAEFPDIAYIRWQDACVPADGSVETNIDELGPLLELHACGWLLKETETSYTLGLEVSQGACSFRVWQTIPKINVVEVRKVRLPRPRGKKERIGVDQP